MKRGDVWTVAGAGYAGKPRPGVILQSDLFSEVLSVTICMFTSSRVEGGLVRQLVSAKSSNGLLLDSFAMADKITTVPRSNLGRHIGQLDPDDMARIDLAVLNFLGLAGN
jgi:mRNA interferase MazF